MNHENFAGRPTRPEYAPIDLRGFWRVAPRRSRLALGVAAVSVLAWLASFAGVMRYPAIAGSLFTVHLAVMALFLVHFVRLAKYNRLAWRAGPTTEPGPRQPPVLRLATALSLVLVLVGFAQAASHGEGAPALVDDQEVWMNDGEVVRPLQAGEREAFDAEMLRAFAAVWLFFSLLIALNSRTVELRLRDAGDD